MIVLALDASTKAIGWALFDLGKRHPEDLLKYGLERFTGNIWERLNKAADWLLGWMIEPEFWNGGIVAIETPVVYKSAGSAIKQAYMVGVLGAIGQRKMKGTRMKREVMELRPDERLTALGLPPKCRNPKPWVVQYVNQIYGLELDLKTDHDIADAIALGWAARRRLMQEGRDVESG